MRTEQLRQGETLEESVHRTYALRGPDGHEDPDRFSLVLHSVQEANPGWESGLKELHLPVVPHVPYLKMFVDDLSMVEQALKLGLHLVLQDERLHALSFIDPLRVASEELGITCTPQIAAFLRRRYANVVSFDSNGYEQVRDSWVPGARSPLRWVPKTKDATASSAAATRD